MNLTFTVNGRRHELEIPEDGDLIDALDQLHGQVVNACGEAEPAPDLESRIYVTGLHALVEQSDLDLGEVVTMDVESSDNG